MTAMTTLFLSFAFANYVACTSWVMYHLADTIRNLQHNVAQNRQDIDKLIKSNEDSSCSGCETSSETVNTSETSSTDSNSETSSLGPCPSMTAELTVCNLANDRMKQHIQAMNMRLNQVERNLDLHLDKAFMLVGFEPYTGMPLYVTHHDDDGNVMIRDAVAEYWKSGQMPNFVGEQFAGPEFDLDEREGTELDDR